MTLYIHYDYVMHIACYSGSFGYIWFVSITGWQIGTYRITPMGPMIQGALWGFVFHTCLFPPEVRLPEPVLQAQEPQDGPVKVDDQDIYIYIRTLNGIRYGRLSDCSHVSWLSWLSVFVWFCKYFLQHYFWGVQVRTGGVLWCLDLWRINSIGQRVLQCCVLSCLSWVQPEYSCQNHPPPHTNRECRTVSHLGCVLQVDNNNCNQGCFNILNL